MYEVLESTKHCINSTHLVQVVVLTVENKVNKPKYLLTICIGHHYGQ